MKHLEKYLEQPRIYKRFHKSRSRERHNYRYSKNPFSTNSKKNDESKMSFLYDENNKFFFKFYKRYRAVKIKFFKQI